MSEMKMPQQRRLRNPLWDYRIPDAELSQSQRVIADSQTLMDQSYKAAERMQEDVNKKLGSEHEKLFSYWAIKLRL